MAISELSLLYPKRPCCFPGGCSTDGAIVSNINIGSIGRRDLFFDHGKKEKRKEKGEEEEQKESSAAGGWLWWRYVALSKARNCVPADGASMKRFFLAAQKKRSRCGRTGARRCGSR